jgi:ectoine hydroxylase-related dioxygenase (phytanoyl-CoA dioxygenase family)
VRAREAFLEGYDRYLRADTEEHADALLVGPLRHMITVRIEAPFDDELFLANAALLPLLGGVLGEGYVLASYGVVCSLPGAPEQNRHRDGGDLFPESPLDDLLPPCAITMAVPLLEMNELHGTTALWPGSHRSTKVRASGEPLVPVVREGAALLWDYRLVHGGTANRSRQPRPLLYATYCRPWFHDHRNFHQQAPLAVAESVFARLSPKAQSLLARAKIAF